MQEIKEVYAYQVYMAKNILFIEWADDKKPNTKQQMLAKVFDFLVVVLIQKKGRGEPRA